MNADRDRLERLARNLVDGNTIDWESASDPEDPESTRSAIRSLAQVHQLRDFALEASTQKPELTQELADSELNQTGGGEGGITTWGHLELREILGQGTQGIVYRAWDPNLEVDVALKLDVDDRIVRDEARRLARIRHRHVVQVYGAAEHDGRVGLWMEHVRGRTLAERLADEGPMSESEAIDLGAKLANALAAIHAVNVVHQDVKARNVMREEGGRYVLMDLGCGADLDKGQSEVGGTPYYMAPEMIDGSKPDKRADIYSLGVLLYHLVTGHFPYEGNSLGEIRSLQKQNRTPRLRDHRPDLSSGFCRVVEKAITPDPRWRYATAGEMLDDLEQIGASPDLPDVPGLIRRFCQRSVARFMGGPIWARVAITLTVVLIVAAGIWMAIPPERLELAVQLFRVSDSMREPLSNGSRIEGGDVLKMDLQGSTPCHVYVFGCDDDGGLVRLFPLSYVDQQNPLGAGSLHQLPGTRQNKPIGWQVSPTDGHDRLLVIASKKALVDLEEFARRIPELGSPESAHNREVARLRGFEQVIDIPDSTARAVEAESAYRRLKEMATGTKGTWLEEIQLVNAGS